MRTRPATLVMRFVGVGALGFMVQIAALTMLADAGAPPLLATACAVEAAILHNFLWHERWTFGACARASRLAPQETILRRLLRFNGATALVSIAGNLAITHLLTTVLGLPLVLANSCAVALLSATNFIVADRWIWRVPKSSTAALGSPHRAAANWR